LSFEIEQTLLLPEQRLLQGNVVLAREIHNREYIEQTAMQLIQNRDSINEIPVENELAQNAVTGLFERLTAAGHLSHIEFPGDQSEIHLATLKRLLNAYDTSSPDWELRRRYQEICEELTIYRTFSLIESGHLPEDTLVLTASDIPDDNVSDSEKHQNGYRALNAKGMLRSYHFRRESDGSWTRILEQVSRSNSDDFSTRRWYNENAAVVPLNSTGGLSEQIIVSRRRMPDGVVTFTKELDEIFGVDRLYGESGAEKAINNRADYNSLREDSALREEMLSKFSRILEQKDAELKQKQISGEITYQQRLYYFDQEINNNLIPRILFNAPQFAVDTYGKTAGLLAERASILFQQGFVNQAIDMMSVAFNQRDERASTSCGGVGSKQSLGNNPPDLLNSISKAAEGAGEDRKDWKWTKGICQVESCSTRPGKTEVGPCSVCRKCQKIFDSGGDPTKDKSESNRDKREKPAQLIIKLAKESNNEQLAFA
jgi:hypothetical protein